MKTFLFTTLILIISSCVYSHDLETINEEIPIELYLVAPQGRLYRVKRQYGGYPGYGGGGFGASAGQAGSQSFNYSPQGFNAAQSLSGSQTYNFGGETLSVGYGGSFSANQNGASGSFAPSYSYSG
uniref:CSON013618 protein n=1 Tax=Culicoides sonorensis TaxID=179676 RepID=A0A336M8G2_CULSO